MTTEYTLGAGSIGSPAQVAALLLLGLALVGAAAVHLPILARLRAVTRFRRSLAAFGSGTYEPSGSDLDLAFSRSPLATQWGRYKRERTQARAGAASFGDALARQPLLEGGVRGSFLPALPALLTGAGLLASLMVWRAAPTPQHAQLALLPGISGLGLALLTATLSTWLHGRLAEISESLVDWVDVHVRPLAPAVEAAAPGAAGPETEALVAVVRSGLDDGFGRLERAAVGAAEHVGSEQRAIALRVLEDLGRTLDDGVAERLKGHQAVISRSVEQQQSLARILSHHLERLVEDSDAHSRVSFSLEQAAVAVEESSRAIDQANASFRPLLEGIRETEGGMQQAAQQMRRTQEAAARSVELLHSSFEQAGALAREQQVFMETSVGEIRATLELLSQGLGDDLSHALAGVEDVVGKTMSRLSETLLESSQTIDRLAPSMHAAEGMSRELRTSVEQLRSDLTGVSEWLAEAAKPARATLSRLDERTGALVRALSELAENGLVANTSAAPSLPLPPAPRASGPDPWARESTAAAPPIPADPDPPSEPTTTEDEGGLSGLLSRHQFATGVVAPSKARHEEEEESDPSDSEPAGRRGGLRGLLRRDE